MPEKSCLSNEMIKLVRELKSEGFQVKFIRCDNAGENEAFQEIAREHGLGLTFEFTAPNNPEQNGRVERKFQTLYGRVRAMIRGASDSGLAPESAKKLWAEAGATATCMDGLLIAPGDTESAYQ